MKSKKKILKYKCPMCGSEDLHAIGHDQFCLACDWDNCLLLVQEGYMDHLQIAAAQTFGIPEGMQSHRKLDELVNF